MSLQIEADGDWEEEGISAEGARRGEIRHLGLDRQKADVDPDPHISVEGSSRDGRQARRRPHRRRVPGAFGRDRIPQVDRGVDEVVRRSEKLEHRPDRRGGIACQWPVLGAFPKRVGKEVSLEEKPCGDVVGEPDLGPEPESVSVARNGPGPLIDSRPRGTGPQGSSVEPTPHDQVPEQEKVPDPGTGIVGFRRGNEAPQYPHHHGHHHSFSDFSDHAEPPSLSFVLN